MVSNNGLSSLDWVFITGQPGCGKTTCVKKLLETLREEGVSANGVKVTGFYTDEVLGSGSQRVGFDVVSVAEQDSKEERSVLSRKDLKGKDFPKTGQYGVDVASFERVALKTMALPEASDQVVLYVIDEIGRMEMHSERFKQRVAELQREEKALVCGSIAAPRYGHVVPMCEDIKAIPGVNTINMTPSARDETTQRFVAAVIAALKAREERADGGSEGKGKKRRVTAKDG
jgi:nucleoside-triphosphatase THEP1